MKKGQVFEGIVKYVDFPNKGIIQIGEDTIVVKNSLPGQKIKFSISKSRSGKAEGRLLEVIEKSPLQTEIPCSHFEVCGGCTYLTLDYDEQIHIKEEQVHRILKHTLMSSFSDEVWEGIKKSPVKFGYRNKMEFSFGDAYKDGPLSLGMHKRGSFYDIVTVDQCMLVHEDYRKILTEVLNFFQNKKTSFYHRMTQTGILRHLLMRRSFSTGEMLVCLVTTSQFEDKDLLQNFCDTVLNTKLSASSITGVLHITNDALADVVRNDHIEILYGTDTICEKVLGLQFKVTPFSFFQTNTLGAEVLYQTVRDYVGELGKDKIVFDLYSGTGTIAQLMASIAGKVVGVEIVEEAMEAAKESAKQNGLHNCEFIAGDVLKVLDDISEKPDLIILDPPRDGIHPKALPKIINYGVNHIVYISCKPTSLARDLCFFTNAGYRIDKAVAVDQFPWTANVETIVLLSKVS